jgi:uncharacterized protein
MPPARTYPPGVPCWIDLEHPDPDRARRFYGRLLGWTFEERQAGYHVALLSGIPVAAIGSIGDGVAGAGRWNTYVSVDDVGAVTEAVRAAGGTVEAQTSDAGLDGPSARCVDPAGARFRVWAGGGDGVQATNVPGAWNVSDLHTPDPDGALAFYAAVFGWEAAAIDAGAAEFATLLRAPGYGEHLAATVDPEIVERHESSGAPDGYWDGIGWLASLESDRDEPHWHVTILVADRDRAVSTAQQLGAEILLERDTRWSRSALVVDPQGAALTVSQLLSGR